MGVTRRGVLAGAGALGVLHGCGGGGSAAPADPPFDPQSWDSVQAQFLLSPDAAQFSAFVFASHPKAVREAIQRHRDALDRDPHYLDEQAGPLDDAVSKAATGYLETRDEQIAYTDSTTMGLGLLYSGLRLRAGDEVLTTGHDFYSTHEALRLRAVRDGVTLRRVTLYDDAATGGRSMTAGGIVDRLTAAVTPRTRVVAITWVHSSTGVKVPVRAIADALRGRPNRPLLCVDAVHGFGAEDATPDQLGADFVVSGCHKWLFGPRGTGLVWGSTEGWAGYTPLIPPFDGRTIGAWLGVPADPVPPGRGATPGGFHTFEYRWALAQAFAFHTAIGRARVAGRTRELASRLKDGLAGIGSKVRLVTPEDPALSAGIVCVDVTGINPGAAVRQLREKRVYASSTPYDPSYLRFGTSIVTRERDIEAAISAVRAL